MPRIAPLGESQRLRVRFAGAPGASRVGGRALAGLFPAVHDRIDDAPRFFDFVAASKQGAVAEHRIEDWEAVELAHELTDGLVRKAYKL